MLETQVTIIPGQKENNTKVNKHKLTKKSFIMRHPPSKFYL